jgi:hypothetical protein
MAKPPHKEIRIFPESIDGVFGRFKTFDSYEVNYILCCLNIKEISRLSTASSAFEFSKIRFEDLMQRDVDYERVDEKIIKEYLEKGAGRVLFFPPIIVSVISIENDQVKETYDTVDKILNNENIEIIFDKDKFCVELSTTEIDLGYSISVDEEIHFYNPAWATFKYNSRKIKLIVIDGQHRFEALMRLDEKNKDLLQSVELPVCIVFTPAAESSEVTSESIVKDLREMFVTINTTAKEVSGHFIDLLKDKSLASMSVRSLANLWKQSNSDPCYSKLQQLEWNERRDNRANTVQRKYSITTVSILADSLRFYAFSDSEKGLQYQLLDLPGVESELETDENAISAISIEESEFHISQEPILRKQIDMLVTPALDILFTLPRPYKEVRESFLDAVEKIDEQIQEGKNNAATFKEEVLSRFRRCTGKDQASIRNFQEREFDILITQNDEDKVYFLNVFQQALVGVWAALSADLAKDYSIPPSETAEILVQALNKFVFDSNNKLFDRNLTYTNFLLYSGNRVILAQYAKKAWRDLLHASLLHTASKNTMKACVEEKFSGQLNTKDLFSSLVERAEQALERYLKELHKKISDVVEKEWENRPYPRGLKDKLELLSRENPEKFIAEIESLATVEYREAVEKLSNKLDLDPKDW